MGSSCYDLARNLAPRAKYGISIVLCVCSSFLNLARRDKASIATQTPLGILFSQEGWVEIAHLDLEEISQLA